MTWKFEKDKNLISILSLLKEQGHDISWDKDTQIVSHKKTGYEIRFLGRSNVYAYEILVLSHPRKYLLRGGTFHIRPGQIIELLGGNHGHFS